MYVALPHSLGQFSREYEIDIFIWNEHCGEVTALTEYKPGFLYRKWYSSRVSLPCFKLTFATAPHPLYYVYKKEIGFPSKA